MKRSFLLLLAVLFFSQAAPAQDDTFSGPMNHLERQNLNSIIGKLTEPGPDAIGRCLVIFMRGRNFIAFSYLYDRDARGQRAISSTGRLFNPQAMEELEAFLKANPRFHKEVDPGLQLRPEDFSPTYKLGADELQPMQRRGIQATSDCDGIPMS